AVSLFLYYINDYQSFDRRGSNGSTEIRHYKLPLNPRIDGVRREARNLTVMGWIQRSHQIRQHSSRNWSSQPAQK
ncbi:MAG: hypothetical protein WBQ54_11235, partial [Pseudolabrys sp.]